MAIGNMFRGLGSVALLFGKLALCLVLAREGTGSSAAPSAGALSARGTGGRSASQLNAAP